MTTPKPELQLLIDVYDPLDPDRSDLVAYLEMTEEFGARSVIDLGCGTGVLALLMAERGLEVVGLDPSIESLIVARRNDSPARVIAINGVERSVPLLADRVTWIHGVAQDLPDLQVDLVVCTGNAMQQAFVEDEAWAGILTAMHRVVKPGGRFIFETRDPARRAWEGWTPDATRSSVDHPEYGPITVWNDIESVTEQPLIVTHRGYHYFQRSEITIISGPETLRFREKDEIIAALIDADFHVDEIRDAPDRPGREWVFIARRR